MEEWYFELEQNAVVQKKVPIEHYFEAFDLIAGIFRNYAPGVKLGGAGFSMNYIGEEFPAAVSGVTRFGIFAALPNGVEGLIPVETLPRDHYGYDEMRMCLTGERTGEVYTFGMALTVVCVAADPSTGRIDFRLPGQEEVPARGQGVSERSVLPRQGGDRGRGKPSGGKKRGSHPAMHVPKRGKRGKRR